MKIPRSVRNGSHWYRSDGSPCHQVKMVSRPSEMRPTTLADARKMDLLPSVTNVLTIKGSASLVRWQLNELANVCYSNRPDNGEPPVSYSKRVIALSHEKRDDAAVSGSAIHAGVENRYLGRPCAPEVSEHVNAIIKALSTEGFQMIETETVVTNRRGFAGTMDLAGTIDGKNVVADIKTKTTSPDKSIFVAPDYALQLAAYGNSFEPFNYRPRRYGDFEAFNIIVSRNEVGRVEIVRYTENEMHEAYDCFLNLLEAWKYFNGYDASF